MYGFSNFVFPDLSSMYKFRIYSIFSTVAVITLYSVNISILLTLHLWLYISQWFWDFLFIKFILKKKCDKKILDISRNVKFTDISRNSMFPDTWSPCEITAVTKYFQSAFDWKQLSKTLTPLPPQKKHSQMYPIYFTWMDDPIDPIDWLA